MERDREKGDGMWRGGEVRRGEGGGVGRRGEEEKRGTYFKTRAYAVVGAEKSEFLEQPCSSDKMRAVVLSVNPTG